MSNAYFLCIDMLLKYFFENSINVFVAKGKTSSFFQANAVPCVSLGEKGMKTIF